MVQEEKEVQNILDEYIANCKQFIQVQSKQEIIELINNCSLSEIEQIFYHLGKDERTFIIQSLDSKKLAEIVESINEVFAIEILEELEPKEAAEVIENLDSDDAVDILTELDDEDVQEIIDLMEPEEAKILSDFSKFEEGTAGALMMNEFLSYPVNYKIIDIINDLKENSNKYEYYNIQYIYIVDDNFILIGVVRMRELLFRPNSDQVNSFMISNPKSLNVFSTHSQIENFFEETDFLAAPVIDNEGKMLGVVRRADLEEELGEKVTEDHLKTQGIVGGDELRSMPFQTRSKRRVSWLSINILLNILSASVIALFQDTLEAAITLAIFLPIISDMGGSAGYQAVAVSMRELSLGLVKPYEIYWVWIKEVSLGLANGLILGVLISLATIIWKGNFYLGAIVGVALFLNTLIAVSLGGVLPLALKKLNIDPAIASGPILTTLTDMTGFFLLLGIASLFLGNL